MGEYAPADSIKQVIYNISASLGGMPGTRMMIMIGVAAGATAIFHSLSRSRIAALSAGLIVLAGLAAPLSENQYLIVKVTHGSRALIPALFAMWLLASAANETSLKATSLKALGALSLFVLTQHFSPIGSLVSLSGLVFVFYRNEALGLVGRALLVLTATLPAAFNVYVRVLSKSKSHYIGIEGWLDSSASGMALRAIERLKLFFVKITPMSISVYIVLGLVAVAAAILLYWSLRRRDERTVAIWTPGWVFPIALLFASALSFAPTLPVVSFALRYFEFPGPLGLWGGLSLAAYLIHRLNRKPLTIAFQAILAGTIAGWSLMNYQIIQERFGPADRLARALDNSLREEAIKWPYQSQILIELDAATSYMNWGTNHWSTWELRYRALRPDVIGLIGYPRHMIVDPFVDEWTPSGSEFSRVNSDGRWERIRMKGLERDRPTFVYRYVPGRGLKPLEGILLDYIGEGVELIPYGTRPEQVAVLDEGAICEAVPEIDNWAVYHIAGQTSELTLPEASDRVFDGSEATVLDINSEEFQSFALTLKLVSGEGELAFDTPYSNSYPPMPLLWRPLRIDQRSADQFNITLGDQIIRARVKKGEALRLRLTGKRGCRMTLRVNDDTIRLLGGEWLSSQPLELGRGFKNRFWKGRIEDLTLEIETSEGETRTYTFDDFPEN